MLSNVGIFHDFTFQGSTAPAGGNAGQTEFPTSIAWQKMFHMKKTKKMEVDTSYLEDTLPKTNMTNWRIPIFNGKYIFIHDGGFAIVMLVFLEDKCSSPNNHQHQLHFHALRHPTLVPNRVNTWYAKTGHLSPTPPGFR